MDLQEGEPITPAAAAVIIAALIIGHAPELARIWAADRAASRKHKKEMAPK